MSGASALPSSVATSNLSSKAEDEASVELGEAERVTAEAEAAAKSAASPSKPVGKPTAVIIIGMAGSGKSTLMQRLNATLHGQGTPYYMVNLDPAVLDAPFGPHVDIRDTVNYKEVMKQVRRSCSLLLPAPLSSLLSPLAPPRLSPLSSCLLRSPLLSPLLSPPLLSSLYLSSLILSSPLLSLCSSLLSFLFSSLLLSLG